jgi:hypothetical protein
MERALVGPSGLSVRCLVPNLAFVAQMPQNPRAEPAGSLVQLCLPGFGLVLVAVPNPPWAASPLSDHAVQPYPVTAGWHHWTPEPIRGNKRQTMNRRRTGGPGGEVMLRRLTAFLVVGVLVSVAGPLSGAAAATSSHRARSYPLPSDGWKPGQPAMTALSFLPFRVSVTHSGTCTSNGSLGYLWPAGYRVRIHPTVLLDPKGRVVARQGQYVSVGGGIVGTASWPSAARCYKAGDVWAIQGSVQEGRAGLSAGPSTSKQGGMPHSQLRG